MDDTKDDDNAKKSPGFAEFVAGGVAAAAGLGVSGSIYGKKLNITSENMVESQGKIKDILSSLKKPADKVVAVFNTGGTRTQVTMGVIGVASAIAAGYATNKFRNRTPEPLPDTFTGGEDARRAADAGAARSAG